ncbi:MAG: hypothetical protein ACPGWR_01000 [Ardenticatenaceae bacterium]
MDKRARLARLRKRAIKTITGNSEPKRTRTRGVVSRVTKDDAGRIISASVQLKSGVVVRADGTTTWGLAHGSEVEVEAVGGTINPSFSITSIIRHSVTQVDTGSPVFIETPRLFTHNGSIVINRQRSGSLYSCTFLVEQIAAQYDDDAIMTYQVQIRELESRREFSEKNTISHKRRTATLEKLSGSSIKVKAAFSFFPSFFLGEINGELMLINSEGMPALSAPTCTPGPGSVDIKWSAIDGALRYEIEVQRRFPATRSRAQSQQPHHLDAKVVERALQGTSREAHVAGDIITLRSLEVAIGEIQANKLYEGRVAAINIEGHKSNFSNWTSFLIQRDDTPPTTPHSLELITLSEAFELAWLFPVADSQNKDLSHFNIKVTIGDEDDVERGGISNQFRYSAAPGTKAQFAIQAEDRNGNKSDWSDTVGGYIPFNDPVGYELLVNPSFNDPLLGMSGWDGVLLHSTTYLALDGVGAALVSVREQSRLWAENTWPAQQGEVYYFRVWLYITQYSYCEVSIVFFDHLDEVVSETYQPVPEVSEQWLSILVQTDTPLDATGARACITFSDNFSAVLDECTFLRLVQQRRVKPSPVNNLIQEGRILKSKTSSSAQKESQSLLDWHGGKIIVRQDGYILRVAWQDVMSAHRYELKYTEGSDEPNIYNVGKTHHWSFDVSTQVGSVISIEVRAVTQNGTTEFSDSSKITIIKV